MYEKAFEGILTDNERKVYLELLGIGESAAARILEKTGLQNSVFYRTINRLIEKGYVSYILKGKIKHFIASSPETLLVQIKEQEEEAKKVIIELQKLQKNSDSRTTAEVFVGIKGIKTMYYNLIEDAKPGEEYLYFGPNKNVFEKAINEIYEAFRAYRAEKKIKVYGINTWELKGKVKKFTRTKDRFSKFPFPSNVGIFRDSIAISSWGEVPTGILIKAKDIADQHRELFWKVWKIAKE